jgi:hypothetical protein
VRVVFAYHFVVGMYIKTSLYTPLYIVKNTGHKKFAINWFKNPSVPMAAVLVDPRGGGHPTPSRSGGHICGSLTPLRPHCDSLLWFEHIPPRLMGCELSP